MSFPSSIQKYFQSYHHTKPLLVVDIALIRKKYKEFQESMPTAQIYYAVKANPDLKILTELVQYGACFDVASLAEIHFCLQAGAKPEHLSFGNTIKKPLEIKEAYKLGIRDFSVDSLEECQKIAKYAPKASLFYRILCDCSGADWPLSKKFGADLDMIFHIIQESVALGLTPKGLVFHVGSQQSSPQAWEAAIQNCAILFQKAKEKNIDLKSLNLGGGFPVAYNKTAMPLKEFSHTIMGYVKESFKEDLPEIIIEPGRALVAESGVIQAEILLISHKSVTDISKWLYLDIGKFGGLIETMDEAIRYPFYTQYTDSTSLSSYIIAGPTCDSVDILYEKKPYKLPATLSIGDKIWIGYTGAYTTTYSSVCFNGIDPLQCHIIDGTQTAMA